MRIACIYVPSFPLQAYLLRARHLVASRGARSSDLRAALAISDSRSRVGGSLQDRPGAPTVVACSRAAAAAGVRIGMPVAAARSLASDLMIVPTDGEAERAALGAIAEALLGVASRVDIGGAPGGTHHALYAEVPVRCRGATFGARVQDVLAVMGIRGRVGIADDRFTAWVAASTCSADRGVVSVPRGGSAAFLAPLSLSLLAIPAEVRAVLESVGVRTLGEFAALPPPSVTRPWDADLQALARGDGGASLAPFVPMGAIVERIELGGDVGLGAAVGAIAGRLAARLAGRGRAAAELIVRVIAGAKLRELNMSLPSAMTSGDDLADAIGGAVAAVGVDTTIEVEVRTEVDPAGAAASVAPAPAEPATQTAQLEQPATADAPGDAFQLEPSIVSAVPTAPHRRTRRGKHRPRTAPGAQSRLFAGLDG